jgi:hypothetical protein
MTDEVLTQIAGDVPALILAVWYVRNLHGQALSLLTEIRDELRVARALRSNGGRDARPLGEYLG